MEIVHVFRVCWIITRPSPLNFEDVYIVERINLRWVAESDPFKLPSRINSSPCFVSGQKQINFSQLISMETFSQLLAIQIIESSKVAFKENQKQNEHKKCENNLFCEAAFKAFLIFFNRRIINLSENCNKGGGIACKQIRLSVPKANGGELKTQFLIVWRVSKENFISAL